MSPDANAPEGMRIAKIILQSGTVPLPGMAYERVTEFSADPWTIEHCMLTGGFRVSRGEQVLDLVGIPLVVVYEPIPGAKRDRA